MSGSSADYAMANLEPVGSLVIESKNGDILARIDLAAAAPWIAALAELAGAVLRASQPPQFWPDDADAAKRSEGTEP